MRSSSFLHKSRDAARRSVRYLGTLAKNPYFWGGLGALIVVLFLGYAFVNGLMMPLFTRHDVTVEVPSVVEMTFEEAQQALARQDLQAERVVERFNPDLPRDVIVDQDPQPGDAVKPGRRVYLTVNTGEVPRVVVPAIEQLSLREAENRLQALGLTLKASRPDTIPSPHSNTVTRVEPAPGTSVERGSSVTLWYSTGPGDRYVAVPDVTGLTPQEAEETLLNRKLRSVVVGSTGDGLGEPQIRRQSPEPGTRMREGSEIRLFLTDES